MRIKIYYHQTDCGGVVYYANYLHFLEEARTEFLASRGVDIRELIAQGSFFVVSHQELDYKSPAGYGDILDIDTHLKEITGVRINLEHKIKKTDGILVAQAMTTLAFVNREFRPKPIPQAMRESIERA